MAAKSLSVWPPDKVIRKPAIVEGSSLHLLTARSPTSPRPNTSGTSLPRSTASGGRMIVPLAPLSHTTSRNEDHSGSEMGLWKTGDFGFDSVFPCGPSIADRPYNFPTLVNGSIVPAKKRKLKILDAFAPAGAGAVLAQLPGFQKPGWGTGILPVGSSGGENAADHKPSTAGEMPKFSRTPRTPRSPRSPRSPKKSACRAFRRLTGGLSSTSVGSQPEEHFPAAPASARERSRSKSERGSDCSGSSSRKASPLSTHSRPSGTEERGSMGDASGAAGSSSSASGSDSEEGDLVKEIHTLGRHKQGPWNTLRWLEVREQLLEEGRVQDFKLLMKAVRDTTDAAVSEQRYELEDGTPVSLHDSLSSAENVRWFGRSNIHVPPTPKTSSIGPDTVFPPLIVVDQSPLDCLAQLEFIDDVKKRKVAVVLEVSDFTPDGRLNCGLHVRSTAVTQASMVLRTDTPRFVEVANEALRSGKCSVRDHLTAQHDPYVIASPGVTAFRGPREDGFPFLENPVNVTGILCSMTTQRPAVSVVSNPATSSQGESSSEWYTTELDQTSLLERLNLIGFAALQDSALESVESGNVVLILSALGCNDRGLHPRDAVANSLKHWRRRFSHFFHTVILACGPDPDLASHFDMVINQQVYTSMVTQDASNFSPWHWEEEYLRLHINSTDFMRLGDLAREFGRVLDADVGASVDDDEGSADGSDEDNGHGTSREEVEDDDDERGSTGSGFTGVSNAKVDGPDKDVDKELDNTSDPDTSSKAANRFSLAVIAPDGSGSQLATELSCVDEGGLCLPEVPLVVKSRSATPVADTKKAKEKMEAQAVAALPFLHGAMGDALLESSMAKANAGKLAPNTKTEVEVMYMLKVRSASRQQERQTLSRIGSLAAPAEDENKGSRRPSHAGLRRPSQAPSKSRQGSFCASPAPTARSRSMCVHGAYGADLASLEAHTRATSPASSLHTEPDDVVNLAGLEQGSAQNSRAGSPSGSQPGSRSGSRAVIRRSSPQISNMIGSQANSCADSTCDSRTGSARASLDGDIGMEELKAQDQRKGRKSIEDRVARLSAAGGVGASMGSAMTSMSIDKRSRSMQANGLRSGPYVAGSRAGSMASPNPRGSLCAPSGGAGSRAGSFSREGRLSSASVCMMEAKAEAYGLQGADDESILDEARKLADDVARFGRKSIAIQPKGPTAATSAGSTFNFAPGGGKRILDDKANAARRQSVAADQMRQDMRNKLMNRKKDDKAPPTSAAKVADVRRMSLDKARASGPFGTRPTTDQSMHAAAAESGYLGSRRTSESEGNARRASVDMLAASMAGMGFANTTHSQEDSEMPLITKEMVQGRRLSGDALVRRLSTHMEVRRASADLGARRASQDLRDAGERHASMEGQIGGWAAVSAAVAAHNQQQEEDEAKKGQKGTIVVDESAEAVRATIADKPAESETKMEIYQTCSDFGDLLSEKGSDKDSNSEREEDEQFNEGAELPTRDRDSPASPEMTFAHGRNSHMTDSMRRMAELSEIAPQQSEFQVRMDLTVLASNVKWRLDNYWSSKVRKKKTESKSALFREVGGEAVSTSKDETEGRAMNISLQDEGCESVTLVIPAKGGRKGGLAVPGGRGDGEPKAANSPRSLGNFANGPQNVGYDRRNSYMETSNALKGLETAMMHDMGARTADSLNLQRIAEDERQLSKENNAPAWVKMRHGANIKQIKADKEANTEQIKSREGSPSGDLEDRSSHSPAPGKGRLNRALSAVSSHGSGSNGRGNSTSSVRQNSAANTSLLRQNSLAIPGVEKPAKFAEMSEQERQRISLLAGVKPSAPNGLLANPASRSMQRNSIQVTNLKDLGNFNMHC